MNQKIQLICDKIITKYAPEKIILFGSHANGTATQDSDVDLVIIKDGNESFVEKSMAVRKILRRSGVPLDILVYSPEEWDEKVDKPLSFENNIANQSVLLYARGK